MLIMVFNFVSKAQVLANSGEMQRAEEMLLTVLHHNPYHTEALHCLANVLGQKGKHEEVMDYIILFIFALI